MARDFDDTFYLRFSENCVERLGKVRESLQALGSGDLSQHDALQVIVLELHGLAGEASLLGLRPLGRVARQLKERLKQLENSPTGPSAQALESLLMRLVELSARYAEGNSDPKLPEQTEALQASIDQFFEGA